MVPKLEPILVQNRNLPQDFCCVNETRQKHDPKNGVTIVNKENKNVTKNCSTTEAGIFFRWVNWMIENIPTRKKPLFINMDETSVAFAYPGQKGNVAQQQHTGRPQLASYTEKATLSIRRGNVTYCAFIASDMAVQSLLPQIVIGNKKKFTRELLRSAWADQPDFVQTWNAETGWINQTMMK